MSVTSKQLDFLRFLTGEFEGDFVADLDTKPGDFEVLGLIEITRINGKTGYKLTTKGKVLVGKN